MSNLEGFCSRFGEPELHSSSSSSWALIRRNRNSDFGKSFCQDSVVRLGQNTRLLMGTTEKPNVIHETTTSENEQNAVEVLIYGEASQLLERHIGCLTRNLQITRHSDL